MLGQGVDNDISSAPMATGKYTIPDTGRDSGNMGLSLRRFQEDTRVDVSLITLADLQTQGRTSTAETRKPSAIGETWASESHLYTDNEKEPTSIPSGVRAVICSYSWPQGCDYWVGIARCESTLGQDPDAYADWNPYVGLFQIWIGHNYERGWLKDDANNVLAAWELSREGAYTGAWPYCQWQ